MSSTTTKLDIKLYPPEAQGAGQFDGEKLRKLNRLVFLEKVLRFLMLALYFIGRGLVLKFMGKLVFILIRHSKL
jgi:hypothetical protein